MNVKIAEAVALAKISGITEFIELTERWVKRRPGKTFFLEASASKSSKPACGSRGSQRSCFQTAVLALFWVGVNTSDVLKSSNNGAQSPQLAVTYRGGVIPRAITIWLKPLGDTA